MAVRYDWFLAPDDAAAAATIDPVAPAGGSASYRTVADTRIDPVAQGGTLEELLTGRSVEQLEQDPRWGAAVAARDGGELLVLTVTDSLTDALASAEAGQLGAVVGPWSRTEEFGGDVDPETLRVQLLLLSSLAKEARRAGGSLYCRVRL